MSQDPKLPRFKAFGAVKVDVCKSLIDAKETVWSSRFSDPKDPHPTEFRIKLKFGCEKDGFLSCYGINVSKRDVTYRDFQIRLFDDKMSVLFASADEYNQKTVPIICKPNCGPGYPKLHSLVNVVRSDADIKEWNITFAIVYDGVFIDADFRKEYLCKNAIPNVMLTLLESGTNADVTFLVKNEKIEAHKLILQTRSSFFQNMFDSGMKESLTNEIKLEDLDPAMFKEILKFLYSGIPPENLPNLAMELFPLADRFDILDLKEMCVPAICSILSAENVVDALILADLLNDEHLKDVCAPVFKKNKKEIQKGEDWNRLSEYPHIMIPLLASFND